MKYNCKVKLYPNDYKSIVCSNKCLFNNDEKILKRNEYLDYSTGEILQKKLPSRCCFKDDHNVRQDSINRARSIIFDSIMLNDFDLFCTLTFNDSLVNAYDIPIVMKKLSVWLRNLTYRKGLKYILVPEYHKSGRVHCHLLCNNVFNLVESGSVCVDGLKKPILYTTYKRLYNGLPYHVVYNIPEWKYGYTTAIELYYHKDDYNIAQRNFRIASYITCYITKNVKGIFGKFYWSSHNILKRPDCEYFNIDFDTLKAQYQSNINDAVKYKYLSNFNFSK